jgi:hypothetical protein
MYFVLIALAAASRLAPHPPNFAPIAALGLFAGAYAAGKSGRIAWLAPLAALLIGDAIIGFYSPLLMAFVYSGFAIGGVLGRAFLHEERTTGRLIACSLAASGVFFVISNLGVWLGGHSHTWIGLGECYVRAIPFFRNTLMGVLVYSGLLFGLYEAARLLAGQRSEVSSS